MSHWPCCRSPRDASRPAPSAANGGQGRAAPPTDRGTGDDPPSERPALFLQRHRRHFLASGSTLSTLVKLTGRGFPHLIWVALAAT